jgi:3-dehydroquinate synthase
MNSINIKSNNEHYKVYIDKNLDMLYKTIYESGVNPGDKLFLITDSKVYSLYNNVIKQIEKKHNCRVYSFTEGEESKNKDTIDGIYTFLIQNNANRKSILIAFGGGVVGDIVGFVAATFMRGIKFINIPTTLISQVDSCIGGKVAYNYNEIKNIIGTFYNPIFVFINVGFIRTLDELQFRSGLGEVLKYGISLDYNLFKFLEDNYFEILQRNEELLKFLVQGCLHIKKEIVEKDFQDNNIRNVLNFGHTVGHALETLSEYKIPHGIAVALGIEVAIKLSEKILGLEKGVYERVESIYMKLGIPVAYKVDNYSLFLYAINRDKKKDEAIRFALLEALGITKVKIEIEEMDIFKAIEESINEEV